MRDEALDGEHKNFLQMHRWSTATLKVLSSMPSRTAGETETSSAVQYFVDGVMYACELLYLTFVHAGPNSDAVISWRARRSSELHRHQTAPHDSSHPSRLIQDDFVQAHVEEIGTEGGPKMLKLLTTPNTRQLWFTVSRSGAADNLVGFSLLVCRKQGAVAVQPPRPLGERRPAQTASHAA